MFYGIIFMSCPKKKKTNCMETEAGVGRNGVKQVKGDTFSITRKVGSKDPMDVRKMVVDNMAPHT